MIFSKVVIQTMILTYWVLNGENKHSSGHYFVGSVRDSTYLVTSKRIWRVAMVGHYGSVWTQRAKEAWSSVSGQISTILAWPLRWNLSFLKPRAIKWKVLGWQPRTFLSLGHMSEPSSQGVSLGFWVVQSCGLGGSFTLGLKANTQMLRVCHL